MQGRVEGADGRRQALQFAEDAGEIVALVRQQLGQGLLAVLHVVGQDHLAHGVNTISLEEHVLGAAQADADGAEGDGVGGLFGGIGVGADSAGGWLCRTTSSIEESPGRSGFP